MYSMGQYLNQKDNRTELQQRLDAELRAKMAAKAKQERAGPDGVHDSAFIEGTKPTTSLAWAWALIFIMALVALGVFIWRANTV